ENNFCSHCGQPLWFGWPEEKVLATLGEPNEKEKGRYWILTESNQSTRFVEQCSDGSVRHIDGALVHGPIAPGTRIPVFTPYETWRYHNVRDNVLQLYLTQTPEGQRIVADVCQYP